MQITMELTSPQLDNAKISHFSDRYHNRPIPDDRKNSKETKGKSHIQFAVSQ